jgi:hypothetical protein
MLKLIKLLITLILGILVLSRLSAQFVNDSAIWISRVNCFGSASCDTAPYSYKEISFIGDTIINDTIYKLMNPGNLEFGIFEDHEKRKVYYRLLDDRVVGANFNMLPLYDFSLAVGDTFNIQVNSMSMDNFDFVVKEVDSIEINGSMKRRFLLEESEGYFFYNTVVWIEDIGSTYGPIWNFYYPSFEIDYSLDCYLQKNKPVYGTCSTVSISNNSNKDFLRVHQTQSNIVVTLRDKKMYLIELIDMQGKSVFKQSMDSDQFFIPNYFHGIFLLKVYSSSIHSNTKICVQ